MHAYRSQPIHLPGEITCLYQSVARRSVAPELVAPDSSSAQARSGKTNPSKPDQPQARASQALALQRRTGLPVKAALAAVALAAQADAVRALHQSTIAIGSGAFTGGVIGTLIGMCCAGQPDHVVADGVGALAGVMLGMGVGFLVSEAASNGSEEERLEVMARQATQATSNAAATLFTAIQNNPGTAALIATAALALTAGTAAYVANKTNATDATAREPLTAAQHAV
jgi:hypothetical protein